MKSRRMGLRLIIRMLDYVARIATLKQRRHHDSQAVKTAPHVG